jgi:hypothetical protein
MDETMHAALKLLLLLIVFILAATLDGMLVCGVKKVSGPQPGSEPRAVEVVLPQAAQTAPQVNMINQTAQPVTPPPKTDGTPSPDGNASAPTASRENPPKPSPPSPKQPKVAAIGNSDSKRYHLPGMAYYDQVDAYHRVEFRSEAEAIKAGYRKASR